MGVINIINNAGTNKLSLSYNGTSDKTIDTGNLANGVILQTGGSPTSINNGLIVDYESDTTTLTGGGTAIVFRGKSSGGNIANYDQARIRSYGQDTNNAHGFAIDIKPSAGSALTEAFNINTDGRIRMPLQPAFLAGGNGGWATVTAGSAIPFNVIGGYGYNIGSNYNTATYRFTAPIAGRYMFFTNLYTGNSSTSASFYWTINGSYTHVGGGDATVYFHGGGIGDHNMQPTIVFSLAAGDYVSINGRNTQTSYVYMPHSAFGGYLVG